MRLLPWIFIAQLTLGPAAFAQQRAMPPLPPITDPPSEIHLPGKFVWADLFSSDVEASRNFYEQVFGWEWRLIKEPPQPYGVFYLDELPVAGLAFREAPDGGDSYGRWIHYISVEDVGESEQAIGKRGGRTMLGHRAHADRGDFAILADAHDAPFGIIRSSSGDPGDYRAEHGEWIWREFFTRDLVASIRFYTELFAYEAEKDHDNPEIVDYMLTSHGHLRAGIGSLPPDTETAPTWLGYVRVADIDAAVRRTTAHGGEVILEPRAEIADGGLAIVADPTGATIGLLYWNYGEEEQKEMQP